MDGQGYLEDRPVHGRRRTWSWHRGAKFPRGAAPARLAPACAGLALAGLLAFGAAPAGAETPAGLIPGSFAELADRLSPAVVNITTTTTVAEVDDGCAR